MNSIILKEIFQSIKKSVLSKSYCYFTRLNVRKMGPFQFCLSVFLGINQHLKQKEFLNSWEGFLRAALTGHCHTSPFWKIAEMALFNPCMEFEFFWGQMSSFDAIGRFFPKNVPSFVQVLFQVDELDKLDYLKNPSLDLKNSFCFEFLWIPSNAGRQNLKVPFFLGFNLMKWQCFIYLPVYCLY